MMAIDGHDVCICIIYLWFHVLVNSHSSNPCFKGQLYICVCVFFSKIANNIDIEEIKLFCV